MTKPKQAKRGHKDVDPVDDVDPADNSGAHDSEFKQLLLSISTKMDTLNNVMNSKIDKLESSMVNLVQNVRQELDTRLTNFSADVEKRFSDVEASSKRKCDELVSTVSRELGGRFDALQAMQESRLDKLERISLEKELVISGVPVEHKDQPFGVLGDICNALNCNLERRDFVTAYRLKTNSNANSTKSIPIIVKVSEIWVRNELMSAYFKRGNLNLKDIGFQTTARIYINESLTKVNRAIFNLASEAKKDNLVTKFFTRNGLVHVQRSENSKPIAIHHISELQQLLPPSFSKSNSSSARQGIRRSSARQPNSALSSNYPPTIASPPTGDPPITTASESSNLDLPAPLHLNPAVAVPNNFDNSTARENQPAIYPATTDVPINVPNDPIAVGIAYGSPAAVSIPTQVHSNGES